MKYARIDIETIGFANKLDKAHINFGDHLQNIVIKDLYAQMGIQKRIFMFSILMRLAHMKEKHFFSL